MRPCQTATFSTNESIHHWSIKKPPQNDAPHTPHRCDKVGIETQTNKPTNHIHHHLTPPPDGNQAIRGKRNTNAEKRTATLLHKHTHTRYIGKRFPLASTTALRASCNVIETSFNCRHCAFASERNSLSSMRVTQVWYWYVVPLIVLTTPPN